MRNSCVIIVCLVLGVGCSVYPLLSKKLNSRLKSFTDRYALPTNVHSISSKLPLTFGYRFTDDYGTMQSREENTDTNGFKTGSYSFMDATGIYRHVKYVADHDGFRATVTTNEPGTMAVDPAHVRMLTENKNMGQGALRHINLPQLEYSSNMFSKYNDSSKYIENNSHFSNPLQRLGITESTSIVSNSPFFEPQRIKFQKTKFLNNLNTYNKDSSFRFSSEITSLLQELDDPEPVVYEKPQQFSEEPNMRPDFIFQDKTSNGEYHKPEPTRYPRRHRDSRARAKKSQALKIHIPQGFEDHDLPLYRDK